MNYERLNTGKIIGLMVETVNHTYSLDDGELCTETAPSYKLFVKSNMGGIKIVTVYTEYTACGSGYQGASYGHRDIESLMGKMEDMPITHIPIEELEVDIETGALFKDKKPYGILFAYNYDGGTEENEYYPDGWSIFDTKYFKEV